MSDALDDGLRVHYLGAAGPGLLVTRPVAATWAAGEGQGWCAVVRLS